MPVSRGAIYKKFTQHAVKPPSTTNSAPLMERASSGLVSVNGLDLGRASRRDIPALRRSIGMVHQNHHLLFDRSVFENVALPLRISGFRQPDIDRRVRAALDKVGLLGKEKLEPRMLSGGERGRLALAKLALQDTNLLLLDEPTNHLDIPSQEVLQSVLDNYQGTILLVTHDRYLVDALATQIWEINPDESQMTTFNGTYSKMKEESEKEATRLAEGIRRLQSSEDTREKARRRESSQSAKDERRKLAQLQQLENTIAELETRLANLSNQLESPFVKPHEAAKLGTEYERVQKEMDARLAEWERLQV